MGNWKAITAKVPNITTFYASLQPDLIKGMVPAQKDFQDFVGTWKHKPTIILELKKNARDIEVFTGVISDWSKGQKPKPEDLMMFVGRGTEKGYVVLSHDFKAKTKKGVIKAGSGSGKVLRKSLVEMPGIEDREIEKTVKNKEQRIIIELYKKAIINATIKSGIKRI